MTVCVVPWLDRGRLGVEQHGGGAGGVLLVDPTIQSKVRVSDRNCERVISTCVGNPKIRVEVHVGPGLHYW